MRRNDFFYASCIHNPNTLAGGDRIFIELARRWSKDKITIITSPEGIELCKKYNLECEYKLVGKSYNKKDSTALLFLKRLFSGISLSFNYKLPQSSLIYSTSNFISDVFPCFLLKIFNKAKWLAGYYLAPPNPFYGYDESKSKIKLPGFSDLAFYFQDLLSRAFIYFFADWVYVTSQPDKNKFIKNSRKADKIIVVKGGVDLKSSDMIKASKNPEFDAVFIGRFHKEKGVLELIDIWNYVVRKNKNAKLAMIGNGPLEEQVRKKIKLMKLEKNIILFGFKDSMEKIKIFKNSKIVLHTSMYDSGGMAACEAMACRLPGIAYDLKALKTYYPQGMLKVEIGNKKKYADAIMLLLNNKKLYSKMSLQAYALAREWDWDKRAQEIYNQTFKK